MAYTISFDTFKDIWDQEPMVVIDTNGLLSLYRYSPETTNHVLKVLERIFNNLWIPDQVLQEFQDNHSEVVRREFSKYKEVSKEVERIMLTTKNDISKQFIKFNKFRFPKVNILNEKINNAIEIVRLESKKFEDEIMFEVKKMKK
ncbi:PIN-like domain-containing protein [Paenibacillus monticola]|uniref:PIN like domain-containing protein n=1 Tax=Paenibacillus monticola TaxID=2666075 RepID=A0A7X2L5M1_9BACL|nr:PIN-like domain-containing protein [Paenibacillus monticola]MRN56841.1 hypothetical protein [Paenibacillus monticola]